MLDLEEIFAKYNGPLKLDNKLSLFLVQILRSLHEQQEIQ